MIADLYLRTDDEPAMLAALRDAGLTGENEDGTERPRSTWQSTVDVIGTIHEQTGTTTGPDGEEIPVYEPVPGWHVNVYTRDPAVTEALQPVVLDPPPATPRRKRAGAP